jgi:uncharacterized protein with HEPN domain
MSRNLRLYMEDIVESCDKILSYTSEMSFEVFAADDRTYDAVLLNLQIIGESAALSRILSRRRLSILGDRSRRF